MPFSRDPWLEDARDQSLKAVARIHVARTDLQRLSDQLPSLHGPIMEFADALGDVEAAYRKDPGVYRATRALSVVHLPALVRILTALAERPDTGVKSDTVNEVRAQLTACLEEARTATGAAREKADRALAIEMDVLSTEIAVPREKETPGTIGRALHSTGRVADRLARHARQAVTGTGGEITRRASAAGEVATCYIGGAINDGIGRITDPIEARLKAVGRVALNGTLDAAMSAGIWAILFPPLVPATVFMSLLGSAADYDSALATSRADLERERRSRTDARNRNRERAIARALGRSTPIVRFETRCLHMTLDVETRSANGIVLLGRHSGRHLAELSPAEISDLRRRAPDQETADLLRTWQDRHA